MEATIRGYVLAPWKVPLIIAAITLSMVAGAYFGGPGLAMAMGSLAAGLLVVMATAWRRGCRSSRPRPATVVRTCCWWRTSRSRAPPRSTASSPRAAKGGRRPAAAEVLVLAPNRPRFVERWASDTERGERQAQRCLVLTLAALAKAGIDATARIGDEDPVQAVDDQLRSYPATQVVLVDHPGTRSAGAARQLRSRLRVPFLHLIDVPAEPVAALHH